MSASRSSPCPCGSGSRYGDCCGPYHAAPGGGSSREAEEPEALVRARFSAFALGEIEFLERTLHEDHPDRARPREALLFALRTASSTLKYMGLSFVEARPLDAHGVARALYLARVFRKGTDVSFYELAEFLHDGRGLRYRSGRTRDAHGVRAPEPGLSIDTF